VTRPFFVVTWVTPLVRGFPRRRSRGAGAMLALIAPVPLLESHARKAPSIAHVMVGST
jgi:hypothetical protein